MTVKKLEGDAMCYAGNNYLHVAHNHDYSVYYSVLEKQI